MSRIIRTPVGGQCLPGWERKIAVIDLDAPIVSGDLVQLGIRYPAGRTQFVIKELRTFEGKWYGWCLDGVFWISECSVIPDRVAKVIGKEQMPWTDPTPEAVQPSAEDLRIHGLLTAEARAHWGQFGYERNVPFPGLDAVVGPRPIDRRLA